ncbi:MAG: tRNA (guanosine(37)-N1)-methyltransferase TrmD [Ruminococcus sp.]|jgi:tRNA (guanine37-N1)-methyltransferase|nr:tRNA (guanosine(37)-N1)-methyltransferase TrmD [Ruminococcus sp.]
MRIDIATLFPDMCETVLSESIIGRARKKGALSINCLQIRDFSTDKHRRVDDTPFGGGMGMVMQCQPIYDCFNSVCEQLGSKPHTIYMSPKGSVLNQKKAVELSKLQNIFILCGHYEGVDQRILDTIVDEEISAGDYVLTGGELPALILVDAIARMCDGVLSSPECFTDESFFDGLLEYPQYTRPETWNGLSVPPVLLSGHHKNISEWKLQQSIAVTKALRPDLLK